MADFTAGKPLLATDTRTIETTDEFELEGSYDAGSELITNGGFAGNADGWTLTDAGSYSGGKVVILYAGSGDPVISQSITLESGKVYMVTFAISNSNDGVVVYFNTNGAESPALMGNGVKSFLFTANVTGADTIFIDTVDYTNGNTWTLDNISVKEVTEIRHALIVTDAFGRTVVELGGEYTGNLAIGVGALESNIGDGNIAIGDRAGRTITSGKNNIAIGVDVDVMNAANHHQVAIGPGYRYYGGAMHFRGGTPANPLLPADPTPAQIATALDLLGLVTLV
jgi:hypothetical protein